MNAPSHRRLADAHEEGEQPRPVPLAQRGHDRGRHPQQCGEDDQEQVEPVDSQVVADAELGDPVVVGDELHADAGLEAGEHHDRVGEREHRSGH